MVKDFAGKFSCKKNKLTFANVVFIAKFTVRK